jgi:formyltetrahydrofolate-dependent phosphoribosylglycinamide formyltransferase
MLKRLQKKWNVSPIQLFWILCVFAITGTLTAYISKVITYWLGFTDDTHWGWKLSLRLFILIIGYQVILLTVAFLLGQFPFFWQYEKKILQRLRIISENRNRKSEMENNKQLAMSNEHEKNTKNEIGNLENEATHSKFEIRNSKFSIAIFASGAGTNAQKIIEHFKNHPSIEVNLIVCNKPGAGVLTIAGKEGIPTLLIEREPFFKTTVYSELLQQKGVGFIVLAGFLWKIPQSLIEAYPQRIINIHPALLPKYGGKGMYGANVHAAVIAAGETESGITIHYVDEHYDNGDVIFQATCPVLPGDTPDSLASRIHELEHQYFPAIVEKVVSSK